MHRIDTSGSQNGSFVDEDLQKGVQGTMLSAAWLNTIQDEVISVIESTTAKLDKAKNNQLLIAITSIIRPIRNKIDSVLNAVETPEKGEGLTLTGIRKLLAIYTDSTGTSAYRPIEATAPATYGSVTIQSSKSYETTQFFLTFNLNLPAPKGWDGGWLIEIPVSVIPNVFYLGKIYVPAAALVKLDVTREKRVYGLASVELIQPFADTAYLSVQTSDSFNFQDGERDKTSLVSIDGWQMAITQNIKTESMTSALKDIALGMVEGFIER